METFKATLIIAALGLMFSICTVLVIDSYELEQSGECAQCVLLPYLKPNL